MSVKLSVYVVCDRSSSSDDSDSEAESEMWHEQRRRIKESLKATGTMPSPRDLSKPIAK